jgi:hypothetical protein
MKLALADRSPCLGRQRAVHRKDIRFAENGVAIAAKSRNKSLFPSPWPSRIGRAF